MLPHIKTAAIAVAMALAWPHVFAQTPRQDFKRNVRFSASNYVAYPGPERGRSLTAPPDTLHAFHISHYGRHGSRFLINQDQYDAPLRTLERADRQGKLTLLGRDVVRRLRTMRSEAEGRLGELTHLGWEQHEAIAGRMYDRFPEVFAGDAYVDAKSTVVIRCILSMESELLELTRRNPQLRTASDASHKDMFYMNRQAPRLDSMRKTQQARDAYEAFYNKTVDPSKLMRRLFRDAAYARDSVDARRLNDQLFRLASVTQNSDMRYEVTLYDLFDDDELLANWRARNAAWYMNHGACPTTGAIQPWRQATLLSKIIAEADSCIALSSPGATLRFGHETVLLPLVCLMDINDYGLSTDDLGSLESHKWLDYKVFPMGGNVQLVFYRRDTADRDPWVKLLLNENEARLPLKSPIEPYYRWSDVREFWLNRIDNKPAE